MRLTALTLAAASIALGACSHGEANKLLAPREHARIEPVQVTAELRLTPDETPDRLDPDGREAVRRFAAAYREEGDGPLVITRPRNGEDEASGVRLAGEIRAVLLAEGIHADSIREGAYEAGGAEAAPTLLAYSAWEAQVANCPPIGSQDLTNTRSNTVLPSFGCAVAWNLAAMISDPRDLLGAQTLDAPDPVRRTAVFNKYRAGEATGSARNGEASVAISGAVGN